MGIGLALQGLIVLIEPTSKRQSRARPDRAGNDELGPPFKCFFFSHSEIGFTKPFNFPRHGRRQSIHCFRTPGILYFLAKRTVGGGGASRTRGGQLFDRIRNKQQPGARKEEDQKKKSNFHNIELCILGGWALLEGEQKKRIP